MVYSGGFLVASMTISPMADMFGRRPVVYGSLVVFFVSSLVITWTPNYTALLILKFFIGLGNMGYYIVLMTLGMEWLGPSQRKLAGTFITVVWGVGAFIVCPLVYLTRNWRTFQLVCSAPMAILLSYWWVIPESPRWLLTKGRYEHAQTILQKACSVNKSKMDWSLCDIRNIDVQVKHSAVIRPIFSSPALLLRFFSICINWIALNVGYYGLTLNVGKIGGNVYVNYLATVSVDLAGYLTSLILIDKIGRRKLHCGSMLFGGIACLMSIFTILFADANLNWITVTLSMVGKYGNCIAWGTIYVMTLELFPTVVRSSVLGASNMVGKLGAMAAPYVADLGILVVSRVGGVLPLIVFGASMVIAGFLAMFLPETWNVPLPDTVAEAITFRDKVPKATQATTERSKPLIESSSV